MQSRPECYGGAKPRIDGSLGPSPRTFFVEKVCPHKVGEPAHESWVVSQKNRKDAHAKCLLCTYEESCRSVWDKKTSK